MPKLIPFFLVCIFTSAVAQDNQDIVSPVQAQLDAYNNLDIDAFLIPYSDSVEVYKFPDTLRYKGIKTMRERYQKLFENNPKLHAKLTNRIVQGNHVIDHEYVTGRGGKQPLTAVAIYEVKEGKIQKVWFIY